MQIISECLLAFAVGGALAAVYESFKLVRVILSRTTRRRLQ